MDKLTEDPAEQVFLPLSVRLTPLRRPNAVYSPLPIDEVEEELPPVVRKRKLTQKIKKRSRRSKSEQTGQIFHRDKKQHVLSDIYYRFRYSRVADIDARLRDFLDIEGVDFLANKSVLEINCGIGFVSMYTAAYLAATRVVAVESDIDTLLANLRQLRKFKHDGVRIDTSSGQEQYPQILIRREGVPRYTNKPWRVDPRYSVSQEESKKKGFPFNIEFRLRDDSDEKFDRIFFWDGGNEIESMVNRIQTQLVSPGGVCVVQSRQGIDWRDHWPYGEVREIHLDGKKYYRLKLT
jgi:SAM-dependent methyltransferase